MNFDIVVKQEPNGSFTVFCSGLPEIKGNGKTVQDAMETILDPLVDKLGEDMKQSLRFILRDMAAKAPPGSVPENFHLPISLN